MENGTPAATPVGVKNVLIYARYSTEDQNPRSIDAQVAFCRKWLVHNGYASAEVVTRDDMEISGEILSRPGINDVHRLIQTRQFGLLVGEDVARFYRNEARPFDLAGLCQDLGCRFVAINDRVDTATTHWRQDMRRAVNHHSAHNEDTSERIKRGAQDRWECGHAMGPRFPGYIRTPLNPVQFERTHRGPFVDQKDDRWTSVLVEVFERVARGDPLRDVAVFATAMALPRASNAKSSAHTDRSIRVLIQNPIYRGVEEFGKTYVEKHNASGRHLAKRNLPEKIRSRPLPHLAHIPELLWKQANQAIRQRDLAKRHPRGHENATFRVSRESRTPLAGHAVCGVCGGKMLGLGRDEGGYRCGNALREQCWNRATVKRSLAVPAIFQAVINELLDLQGVPEDLVQRTQLLIRQDGDVTRHVAAKTQELQQVVREIERLTDAVTLAPDVRSIVARLQERERRQAELEQEIKLIEQQTQKTCPVPSAEAILAAAQSMAQTLVNHHEPEARLLLRQLTTPIRFVPFRRVDSDLVVLRARFQVHFLGLLPGELQMLLRATDHTRPLPTVAQDVLVDLFDPPLAVVHASKAFALFTTRPAEKAKVERIAQDLGITRRSAYDAIKLGSLMNEKNLSDPYVELTVAPERASRWKRSEPAAPVTAPPALKAGTADFETRAAEQAPPLQQGAA